MYRECQGIADAINQPVEDIVVFNYMYELGAFRDFCTSVIMINAKGETVLGRNLDYGFQKYLANSSVTIVYLKNNK
jgi:penicillin V acylase-like amidase (Ntn superfamily)